MTRHPALFLVCAFEVALILFFAAWPASSSSFTEYESNGFVPTENCVEAMSDGFVIKKVEKVDPIGWYMLNVRALFEDKLYLFSYRERNGKHYTD
jgi:hypothetical protein